MVTQRRGLTIIVLALGIPAFVGTPLYAESAAAIAANITAKAGNPEDYTRDNASRGREQKANHSKNGANTGAVVAAVAGAALVAAAVPKLASGIPWEVAVGTALMAKAGMEFAQSAASAATGAANGDQLGRLKLSYDEAGSNVNAQGGANVQQQIAEQLSQNSDLQNVLSAKGVDANQFVQQLASGQMASSDQVAAAMKSESSVDPKMMAQAEAVATAQASQAVSDAMNKVQLQEGSQALGTASAANGGGAGGDGMATVVGGGAGGSDKKDASGGGNEAAPGDEGGRAPASVAVGEGRGAGDVTKVPPGGMFGLGGMEDELLEKLMSNFGGAPKKKEDTAVGEKEKDPLLALGVRRPVGKMTLFQLAHRNFRAYREWRTKKMQADRVRAAKTSGALALKGSAARP